jgi:hypothetical protein
MRAQAPLFSTALISANGSISYAASYAASDPDLRRIRVESDQSTTSQVGGVGILEGCRSRRFELAF